jgi:hypothetical protein
VVHKTVRALAYVGPRLGADRSELKMDQVFYMIPVSMHNPLKTDTYQPDNDAARCRSPAVPLGFGHGFGVWAAVWWGAASGST